MMMQSLLLAAAALLADHPDGGRIMGVVVNGATGAPAPGVEVILRAGLEQELVAVGQTVTDEQGRFIFEGAPLEAKIVYLPGANRDGVHYPGPRTRLTPDAPSARVKLTVYDAISSPSPLVAEEYDLDIRIEAGFLEVTESLRVANPTASAYVGAAVGEMPPVTLKLAIPDGFERVTFYDEFHGRRFYVVAGYVATDIPWPPGERKLKFTYRLPIDQNSKVFQRVLDLPCQHFRVNVSGQDAGQVACNLPRSAQQAGEETIFESAGETLPAGHEVRLEFGRLPTPWMSYARSMSLVILGMLILATVCYHTRFRPLLRGAKTRVMSRIRKDTIPQIR
jgi:hypothetical protein